MKVLLFAVGLGLVAFLTAGAAAVRSVNRIWLRHWVEQRLAGGVTGVPSVDAVRRLLLAASTAVALVAFASGAVVGSSWATEPRALIENVAIAAIMFLVLGQLVPRAVGRRWGTSLVPVTVPALQALTVLLAPLVGVAQRVAARIGAAPAPRPRGSGSREALDDLLREGELEGVGDAGENAIISGVVGFTAKLARDIMTPRTEIFALDRSVPVAEMAAQITRSEFSRVPITDGTIDHVVGMLHAFDVLKWEGGPPPAFRRVVTARDTTVASELLSQLLRERVHLAIIQDASDRTVGLVTLEDLLEELVGDIRDEHDEPRTPAA